MMCCVIPVSSLCIYCLLVMNLNVVFQKKILVEMRIPGALRYSPASPTPGTTGRAAPPGCCRTSARTCAATSLRGSPGRSPDTCPASNTCPVSRQSHGAPSSRLVFLFMTSSHRQEIERSADIGERDKCCEAVSVSQECRPLCSLSVCLLTNLTARCL